MADPFTIDDIVTAPANGTVVITNGGTDLTYQPNPDYCNTAGSPDTFTYSLDPGGSTATVSVTVTCVDDAPVAVDDAVTVAEDGAATTIDVLANDTDVDAGPISIDSVTQPVNGAVVISAAGDDLTYQPDADYCNDPPGTTPDTFTYTLDPGGSTATVSVAVTCVPDTPVANDDAATVDEDAPATTIDVLANDADPDPVGMTIDAASVSDPANGTVVVSAAAGPTSPINRTRTIATTRQGPPRTRSTTASTRADRRRRSAVTVTCVNDDPVAVADSDTVVEDDPATTIDVLANDVDPEGDPFIVDSVTQPPNGTVVITNGGDDLTYQPDADYCNDPPGTTPDTFTYTLAPGGSTATVAVTVTCVDDPPTAVNDTATVDEDDPATVIDVLANDTDIDAGPISIDSVTQPVNGAVVISAAGNDLTYQPDADYCNDPPGTTPDTFTYTLAPGGSTATVSVTVTCVDDPPAAVNDTATVDEDDPATVIDVLANDTDIDGGPISIDSVTQPVNGAVVISAAGDGLTYQPDADYCNDPPGATPDTFTYTLAPGGSTATVTVTVTCVDDPPAAVNDTATVDEDDPATTIDVLANDTDIDGGPITIASASDPANGTVVISAGGDDLTYQPDADYCNDPPGTTPDTFTYTLAPGGSTATVSVTVTCVDDDPVGGRRCHHDRGGRSADHDRRAGQRHRHRQRPDLDRHRRPIRPTGRWWSAPLVTSSPIAGPELLQRPARHHADTFTYTLAPGGSTATCR